MNRYDDDLNHDLYTDELYDTERIEIPLSRLGLCFLTSKSLNYILLPIHPSDLLHPFIQLTTSRIPCSPLSKARDMSVSRNHGPTGQEAE